MILSSIALITGLDRQEGYNGFKLDLGSGSFSFFGDEYVLDKDVLDTVCSLFDFNNVFIGKTGLKIVSDTLTFIPDLCVDAVSIMFGLINSFILAGT